jgi:hypothetical protein
MAQLADRAPLASSERRLALGSFVMLFALVGCALSDDYFIDPNAGTGQGGSAGSLGQGGDDAKGGKAPKGEGGSGGLAGATGGSSGTGGSETGGSETGGSSGMGGSGDDWGATSPPPGGFSPREKAAYTSIGSQLFIWGGVNESGTALNSGALYDPRDDSWLAIKTDANTPAPRSLPSAVWTGSVVVVWGGQDPVTMQPLADGAIYDPVENAWSPMRPGPRARAAAVGASSDERVVFFGGRDAMGSLGGLDVYDPATDMWDDGMMGSPPPSEDPAAAGGTLTFWAYGGRTPTNTGVSEMRYWSMNSARWMPSEPLDPGRWGSFAALADTTFYVWGGRDLDELFGDGSGYGLGTAEWAPMGTSSAPSPRFAVNRESGWTFVHEEDFGLSVVLIGGFDAPGSHLRDGGIYDTEREEWNPIPAWTATASHAFGVAGIASGELIIWGGRADAGLTNEGVRYSLSDSWR